MGQGQGFNLNDFEQSTLALLAEAMGNPGTASLAPLGLGLISGAQERRASNVAERSAGLSSLQQMAAQMASSGASEDAITSLVLGQAQGLPGMGQGPAGQERLGGLASFVGGLYGDGPVSGLAPADYRAQFNTSAAVLDEDDKAAIGSLVAAGLGEGTPFMDLREQVKRTMTAAGGDATSVAAAVSTAEQMYEQMIGMSLTEMRGMGDQLRQTQAAGKLGGLFDDYADQGLETPYPGVPEADVNITDLVGHLANQPGTLSELSGWLAEDPTYTQQSGLANYFGSSNEFALDFNRGLKTVGSFLNPFN